MNKTAVVTMDTARTYIKDYLFNLCDCDPVDYDVDGSAGELIAFMRDNQIGLIPEVPVDVFVDILASHSLK